MKNKGKDPAAKLLNKLKHPSQRGALYQVSVEGDMALFQESVCWTILCPANGFCVISTKTGIHSLGCQKFSVIILTLISGRLTPQIVIPW